MARGEPTESSISTPQGGRSWASLLASRTEAEREAVLGRLSGGAVRAFRWLWELWATPGHQLPPPGDWRTWLIMGGRGAGKTRAGAEWIRGQVEGATPLSAGPRGRIALVAETLDQAREVMVAGPSGLMACAPPDRRPVYQATRRRLEWPNGAEARLFSALDPEALRGPQFDGAWADELAKWRKGPEAWDMLQLGLRLGERPRQVVTTTPRRNPLLRRIMEAEGTVVRSAPTEANRANLAPDFLRALEAAYGDTSFARQELLGELIEDVPGALWRRETLEAGRLRRAPPLARVVVAVDPPATSGPGADECGIVVAGAADDGTMVVLADLSVQGAAPRAWAERVVGACREWEADRIVAEINQGGELVETLIRQVDASVPYRAVRATRGKVVRAEPVAALYEQGRVRHVGLFATLEDQMCAFTGERSEGSPDRVDALVWAVTDLTRGAERGLPQVRRL
ncbi:MAG: DNA-packaging protein [Pseudomonadota bacterium]